MIDRNLIVEMFNKMDEDFKRKHEFHIKNMLESFPCIYLMKEDLLGYLENEYHKNYVDAKTKVKMKQHIENYDDVDMQYIAEKLVQDPMMDAFWISIDCWLDRIYDEISKEDDNYDFDNENFKIIEQYKAT